MGRITQSRDANILRGNGKMRMTPLFGIVGLSLCTYAHAMDESTFQLRTTEDLYRVCTVSPEDSLYREAVDLCEGFLIGAVSYHDAIVDREHLKRLVCYPQTATREQGIKAFVDWAGSHQQDKQFMGDPAVVGLVRGLASRWPCR